MMFLINGIHSTASAAIHAGIGHAQTVDRRLRCLRADHAARERRRQQQTDGNARDKLGRSRAQHELRLADALHTVSRDKNKPEECVERQVDI